MLSSTKWFVILQEQVKSRSRSAVARELGYSPTAISLLMNQKYPGKTDKIAAKILAHYSFVSCPHQMRDIKISECEGIAHGQAPTHNPIKMAQWRACLKCPKRPDKKD